MNTTNVVQLKNYLDNGPVIQDVACLRAVKADKTMTKHLERYKSGKYTKSDIGALTKLFASYRFANQTRKLQIEAFQELTMEHAGNGWASAYGMHTEILHFRKACKITREQTTFGKAWLKQYFFKKDGSPRSGKATEDIGERELKIAAVVHKFELIGVLLVKNQWGDVNCCLPIYRTYNKAGNYFDYSPVHWGQPVIMVGF